MTDDHLHHRIESLAHEEHQLREAHIGEGLTDEQRTRLRELEHALDRSWDLLRQREARRNAGLDPGEATERPARVVEDYLQ